LAVSEGAKVAIIDHEAQGSISIWHRQRGSPDNPHLVEDAPDPVPATKALKAYDYVLVDTAPAGLDQITRAIQAADFVLIPIRASFYDLAAVREAVTICEEQHKPFAFVLNALQPQRAKLNEEAVPYLEDLGHVLAERVEDRTAYITTAGWGKAAFEHSDKRQAKPAHDEISALWAAVKKHAKKTRTAR
jgi:chromosome partitioning protein